MLVPRVPSVGLAVLTALLCGATAAPAANSSHGPASPSITIDGVVVAGGYYQAGYHENYHLTNVEVLDMESLPWLPEEVSKHTLTAVGPILYSCGGHNSTSSFMATCYTLDTLAVERQWFNNVTLPQSMQGHTAVRVSSHIWFTYENVIYDLDTLTGLFLTYDTPFSVSYYHCAVSNSTHSYVLGVGENYTEIWVNTRDYSPASWQQVHVMSKPMRYFDCLWHEENEIFLTGGRDTETRSEVFDVSSSKMHSTGKLVTGRWTHKMGVLDGKPAVFGGYNSNLGEQLASIETFEASTESWTTHNRSLTQARSWFGLSQPSY